MDLEVVSTSPLLRAWVHDAMVFINYMGKCLQKTNPKFPDGGKANCFQVVKCQLVWRTHGKILTPFVTGLRGPFQMNSFRESGCWVMVTKQCPTVDRMSGDLTGGQQKLSLNHVGHVHLSDSKKYFLDNKFKR